MQSESPAWFPQNPGGHGVSELAPDEPTKYPGEAAIHKLVHDFGGYFPK